MASRLLSRISRNSLNQCRLLVSSQPSILSNNNSHSVLESTNKVTLLSHAVQNATCSRGFWFSSSASPQPSEKEAQSGGQETAGENNTTKSNVEATETKGDGIASESVRRKRGTKCTAFSDSDTESDLSIDDLAKLVAEKEELLTVKNEEIRKMQDKVLRSYAEMENVMERTKREAENSKKFAVQNFSKSLLDVADNLGRASSVVTDSFSKIDPSKDTVGAVPLLKTLLEGVEMTDKQLLEVFKKFGVEKYDPMNEQFDPNRHHALFQIPDESKPAGTVAAVLKPGYMLYDRIIRPAEVGVTEAPKSETDDQSLNSEVSMASEENKFTKHIKNLVELRHTMNTVVSSLVQLSTQVN